jgi:hypothetical protein
MKFAILLISTAISCVASSKLISIPFKGIERANLKASGVKNGTVLVDVPLENIDLAYLIDISIGK